LGCWWLFACCSPRFFSGSETALLRLPRHEVETEESPSLSGLAARDLLRNTSRLLVTILLGNNLVNILAASAAGALAMQWLGPQRGLLVSTFGLTVVVLIFCEVLPKSVAARYPRRIGFSVSLPVYLLHWCLRPLHLIFDRIVDPVVRRVGPEPGESAGSSPPYPRRCGWPAPARARPATASPRPRPWPSLAQPPALPI